MRGSIERSGGAIAYEVIDHVPAWEGPAQVMLFHHGVASCAAAWDGWTPALVGRHRLVRFDLRGHGASPLPAGFEWSLDGTVEDLGAVADAAGADRFHLVGESLGGTVALAFAARHPERVLSLTVSNGTHLGGAIENLEPWERLIREEGMDAWSAHLMKERFFDGALTPEMARWYEAQQTSAEPGAVLGGAAMLVGTDLTAELARVACPVLLLHPDSSPFIPVDVMAALQRALPDARLQVFAHARHGLPFSHGAECAAAVARFIDRHTPNPAG
jgi:pimeloyl-ACP methyl ester carboxylesterase